MVDLRPDLCRIAQPALILHGEDDVIVSPDDARQLARLLSKARLVMLPVVGHVPTLTFSREVAREINLFFGG